MAGVPSWVWALVAAGVLILAVGGVFAYRAIHLQVVRRRIVALIGRRENIEASRRTLEAVMRHLLDESDEDLVAFAYDADSEDRKSLFEIEQRMRMLRDDLDYIPLPSRLVPAAQELADAAHVIAEESGRIEDDMDADTVLAALAQIDLSRVSGQVTTARASLHAVAEEFGVEDAAVYGGGLYI